MRRGLVMLGGAAAAAVVVVLVLADGEAPGTGEVPADVDPRTDAPAAAAGVERAETASERADGGPGDDDEGGHASVEVVEEPPRHPPSWAPALVRLRGVATSRGEPRAGLSVELFEIEGEAPHRSTTVPDGSFGFEGLLPGRHVVLWIDREGPLATQRRESLPRVRGGALDLGTVVLDGGGVVPRRTPRSAPRSSACTTAASTPTGSGRTSTCSTAAS